MRSRFYQLFIAIIFFTIFSTAARAATYVVDRTDDVAGANACTAAANDCSLRGAINNANANGTGADTINFNVGGGSGLPQTFNLTAALPDIQTSLTIDGTSQPLWVSSPLIELNGTNAGASASGLNIHSGVGGFLTVTIKGLVINNFAQAGIASSNGLGTNLTITGCYVGTDPSGTIARGNGSGGINIDAIPNTTVNIGGTQTSERNIISGNTGNGITIISDQSALNATAQVNLLNNWIGVSASGAADLGNSSDGVYINDFNGVNGNFSVIIGGALASQRNVISGNNKHGIEALGYAVTIYGNYIGTNANGTAKVANTQDGIKLGENVVPTIGGTPNGFPAGNLISGNGNHGIEVQNAGFVPASIKRNLIGTNAAGTAALGNNSDGIYLFANVATLSSNIIIGSDTVAGDGNTISGNGGDGIDVDTDVGGVKIYGNKVGTNSAGIAVVGNAIAGIRLLSSQNEVGLVNNSTAANIISGNNIGLFLYGTPSTGFANKIYGNYIGTNASGANLGNTSDGVYINGSNTNQLGNGFASGKNTIAFNGGNGINLSDGINNAFRDNSIYGNTLLGIDVNGDGVTPNDAGDTDDGPNHLQNYPVIQRATPTRITATLSSVPNTFYDIEFFYGNTCDPSGYGEGENYLGSMLTQATNANGNLNLDFSTNLTVGQFVTATATTFGGAGHTSEFSQCVQVTPQPGNLTLSAASYTTAESAGQRTIVVNRTGGSSGAIQVDYLVYQGTATPGEDFTGVSGTLVLANGQVTNSFNIPILNDALDETDETVNILLSNPSPGVFLTPNSSAVLTILDDDATPTLSIDDDAQFEGNLGTTQFSFHVSLSAASGQTVTVNYATATGTATASQDYAFASGQVTFQPGETLKSVPVTVIGDLTPELDETFFVNLSNPVNAGIADNQGLGTIKDDDNPGKFSFALAPYSGTEHQQVLVTVARTNGTSGTVTVDYATQGGTATPGADYQPASGTLIFGDGETTKTFFVSIDDDAVPEPAETVNLVLSNPIGGASLGAPSVAVLNIIDDDNGTLLNLAGEVRLANNSPVAGVTMKLQGAQTATTQTDSQGRYSFANLAPNSNYSVTPAALGYTFLPVSQQFNNLAADNLGVNFTATAAPVRQLRVIGGNTTPGQNVSAAVELVAQGDENSVGFSLSYDQTILANPNVVLNPDASTAFLTVNNLTPGKLGVLLALPAGQTFTVGTRSLVTVTFNTMPTAAYNTPVAFGDVPLAREVTNTNANELAVNYLDGAVTFAQGYEADVAPRPTGSGNGSVTIADLTQVGRFVANLDTVNPSFNEFQRADCAPRISLGNGSLTVADYTQAGRYAAGLDPVNPTGGAAIQSLLEFDETGKLLDRLMASKSETQNLVPTVVRVVNTQASPGSMVTVSIESDATGAENGFGFTLGYDASKLSNPVVAKGADTQSATLIPNTNTAGKVGVVLGMPFGMTVAAGTRQIVTIQFNVAANASGGPTPLTFSDLPVVREVSDVNANVLQSNFTAGAVNILVPTAATVTIGGNVHSPKGNPLAQVRVTLTDSDGQTRTARTNSFGNYRFADVATGEIYVLTVSGKGYQFASPTQIVNVQDNLDNLDFVGEN